MTALRTRIVADYPDLLAYIALADDAIRITGNRIRYRHVGARHAYTLPAINDRHPLQNQRSSLAECDALAAPVVPSFHEADNA